MVKKEKTYEDLGEARVVETDGLVLNAQLLEHRQRLLVVLAQGEVLYRGPVYLLLPLGLRAREAAEYTALPVFLQTLLQAIW